MCVSAKAEPGAVGAEIAALAASAGMTVGRAAWYDVEEEAAEMKFKVDIDCTPDEARAFFGLPDVKPLQQALLPEVEERLRTTLRAMDPEAILKNWLPATLKGFEQLQQMFFANMPGASDKKK